MARAVYLAELREAIKTGKIKERPGYELLEVLEPIQIPVRWKEKIVVRRKGVIIGTHYREYLGVVVFNPGDVLHPLWREANEWEREEWKNLSEEKLRELGVFKKDSQFSIKIISKIKDLPAAVRQRTRHIPDSLTSRERKKFVLAGNAQQLREFAANLNNLVSEFLRTEKSRPELLEKASIELTQTCQRLEGSRTSLKRKALEDVRLAIQLARQGKFWEVSAETSQAVGALLNQIVKDYAMAFKSIELGEKWLGLMLDIERKFRNCYNRLGQLGMRLEEFLRGGPVLGPAKLLPIANEAYGIRTYLQKEVHFNLYYQRLQEDDFRRLQNVVKRAEAGRGQTVLNLIKNATAKLEAVAIGEKVTRAELRRKREALF